MPKILVLDNLSQEGVDVFASAPGFAVDVKPPQQPGELGAIIGEYDGLGVWSGTKVTAESIAAARESSCELRFRSLFVCRQFPVGACHCRQVDQRA